MCNLYSVTKGQKAIMEAVDAMVDSAGNMPSMPGVFPDYSAPIVRNSANGRELALARWGMPSSEWRMRQATEKRANKLRAKGKAFDFKELLSVEPDGGVTNIRDTDNRHWTRWYGLEHRCVVPFTSFSENEDAPSGGRQPVWFSLDESRPLAFFAGLWVNWTSVRKVREGIVNADLFGFLTCGANVEVHAIHPKAMPVILRTREEIDTWMTAPAQDALALQRPLPDGSLSIVARGAKHDGS